MSQRARVRECRSKLIINNKQRLQTMKLHLPKALFTAVMALFAISPAAYALTVQEGAIASYDSFLTDGTATTLPDGVTYDATTGVLTGMDTKKLYFTLDTTALTAANANQHVIYITNDAATPVSWGVNTTSDGTNLTGYWSPDTNETTNPGGNWTSSGTADLSLLNTDADGKAVLKASMGSGVGTYLYNDENEAVFSESGLKTGGTITALTVNNTFVSSILYNVQYEDYTVSNADGTFSRTYESISRNAVPETAVGATILDSGVHTINGGTSANLSNLLANGGDIIVGGSANLYLQTWQSTNGEALDQHINFTRDIYLGSSNHKNGALSTASYCGNVEISGKITLIEDSTITKENESDGRNTTTTISGGIFGDYTLTLMGAADWAGNRMRLDALNISGEIDLKGLKFEGPSAEVTLSGTTAIDKMTVNTDTTITKSGDNSMTFGAEGAEATTDAIELKQKLELAGSGIINVNGAIRGTNSANGEFIVGEDITVNADLFHASWSMPTIQIDGKLNVVTFNLSTDAKVSNVSGAGTIKADSFNMGNQGTYNVGGVRIEVGSGGVKSTANGAGHTVYVGDATFAATTDSWTWNTGKDLALADETTGTTFEVAEGKTITIDNRVVNKVVSVTEGEGDEATTTEVTTAGKLIKTGLGTLLLNTNNTYTGDTTVKAGTLEIAANKTMGATAIAVEKDAKLVLNAGTYSNAISGAGQFVKKSDGDVTLNAGASTFSGDVIVEAGWIKTAYDNALGAGSVTIKEGAGVELTQVDGGTGNLTTNSAINLEGGTLRVQNGYHGDIVTSAITVKTSGTIQAGWGGNNGQIASAISGTGELTLNQCIWNGSPTVDTWKLTGVVSDKSASEKLSIHSDANVIMSGTNTYSGGTTVTSETLQTASESALGTGKVTVDGGTLKQDGSALKVTALEYKSGTVNNNGQALEVGSLTVGSTPMAMAGNGTTTVTDTLTVSNANAFTMEGALVLTGATVDLSSFTLDTTTAQDTYVFTLGMAAGGITADESISFTGINVDGYTATLAAAAADPTASAVMLLDGAATNNYLVLTLTKDDDTPAVPTLTTINVDGVDVNSSSAGALTLTTAENATDAVFGNALNAVMDDATWADIKAALKGDNITLDDSIAVTFVGADGVTFDFDGDDNNGTAPVVTINGEVTRDADLNAVGQTLTNNGTTVGNYVTTYIPEPTSTTLSLLALAALAVRRRRR